MRIASLTNRLPAAAIMLLVTGGLCLLPAFARAAEGENSVKEFSLEHLLQQVYDTNPSIQEAKAVVTAAQARTGHVGKLPNPQLKATIFLLPIETRVGPQWLNLSLSQRFPWFGTLSARKDVASVDVTAAEILADARIRDVLVDVKLAYYELHFLYRALEIIRLNRDIATHIVDLGSAAFASDDIPYFDLNRARAELSRLDYDEAKILDQLLAQWHTLNALLDQEPGTLPKSLPQLPFLAMAVSVDQVQKLALANRHELATAQQFELRADKSIDLARKGYWPGFSIGIAWMMHEDEGPAADSGKDALGITLGLDLPIWRSAVNAQVDEAKAMKRRARFHQADVAARTRAAVANGMYEIVDSARLAQLYNGSLLPQAKAALDSAEQEAGRGGSVGSLLERRAIWLQFSLAMQRALADYYKSVAMLERVVGIPLPLAGENEADIATDQAASPPPETTQTLEENGLELPGPEGPGHVDRSSPAHKEAKTTLRELGHKAALKQRLTLALVERLVLRRNPSIKEADMAHKAAAKQYPQVAHLDNIVAQYSDIAAGLRPEPGGMKQGPMKQEAYPYRGTMAIKSDIAVTEVEIAAVATGLARRKAVTAARIAYADYWHAVKSQKVLKELKQLTEQLVAVARQRVSSGAATLSDVLRGEMIHAELETRCENLKDEAARAASRIATLADFDAKTKLGPPQGVSVPGLPKDDPSGRATRRSHEVRVLGFKIAKLKQVIELMKAATYPQLSSGMSELSDPLAKDGKMAFPDRPMVKADIYLAGREAYFDELLERLDSMQEKQRATRAEVRNRVEQESRNLAVARRTARLHGEILIAKSRQNLDLLLAAYQQGKASFTDLVEAEKEHIAHQLNYLLARKVGMKAYFRLQDAALIK